MHYYEVEISFLEIGEKGSSYVCYSCSIFHGYSSTIFYAIVPSMKNHPQLIILNQKINSNTKSPMLLTQLVLLYQINCNTDASNPEPQMALMAQINTYGALIDNDKSLFCINDVCIAHSSSILYLFWIVCEVNRFPENSFIWSFPTTLLIIVPFQ